MTSFSEGIIVATNFFIILFALYYNIKVLRDKTKKDYVLPWRFIFIALIFFLLFEIIGVFNNMGLLNLWGLNEKAQIAYGISRLGIVACFLFGLILEDQHEIIEDKTFVAKIRHTGKKHEKDNKPNHYKKVGKYVKKKKKAK